MMRASWCLGIWLVGAHAWAGPPEDAEAADAEQASATEAMGTEPMVGPVAPMVGPIAPQTVVAAIDPVAQQGAAQLDTSVAFVQKAREGLGLLYERRYRETRTYFAEMEQAYPDTAVSSIADVLVWQAVMLENFDFRHDAQYQAASAMAQAKLTAAIQVEGNEAWEHFMMAGMLGIEAIHTARRSKYIPALNLAFRAIDHVEQVRAVAPDFVDLQLADGLYNYWRTVITQKSKALPDFGDRKAQGIAQVEAVEKDGIFLSPAATLAMAFTWIEEKDYDKAFDACARNRMAYPQNLINELVLGIVYLYKRDHGKAITTFDRVLELDPKSKRVRYYRGLAYSRSNQDAAAEAELTAYLAFDYMEDYQRASGHYRLGQVFHRTKRYAEAEEHYKAAVKINGYGAAKSALDRMRKAKRAGEISY